MLIDTITNAPSYIVTTTRVTSTITLDDTYYVIYANTKDGPFTIYLPIGIDGTPYKIINCGSSNNRLTITPYGEEQIWGQGAGESIILKDGDIINLHFDSTEGWW